MVYNRYAIVAQSTLTVYYNYLNKYYFYIIGQKYYMYNLILTGYGKTPFGRRRAEGTA